MIIETLAAIIQDANLGISGKSLFVFHSPPETKKCILVLNSLDGIERDEYLPDYKKANFRVIVRNPNYKSAMTIAKKVVTAVDLHRKSVNGIYINRMRATHDPIAFPIPDSDVIEVSVNVWVAFVEP